MTRRWNISEILIYTYATISIPGSERIQIGSKSTPLSVTLDSTAPDYFHDTVYLAQNDEVTLASFGSGLDLAAFKVAIFKPTTSPMYVGWRASNSTADNSVIEVAAGAYLILTSDSTTQYNATASTRVDTATVGDISEIYAGNRAAATGRMEVWIVN